MFLVLGMELIHIILESGEILIHMQNSLLAQNFHDTLLVSFDIMSVGNCQSSGSWCIHERSNQVPDETACTESCECQTKTFEVFA